jgi:hypothetical protein
MPKPTPKTTYAATSEPAGVPASALVSQAAPAAMPAPATTSGTRVPRVATSRPASGANTALTAGIGSVHSPASSGDSPRTSCR